MVDYRNIQKIDFFRNFFTGAVVPIMEVILMLMLIKSFQSGTLEKTALIVGMKGSYIVGLFLSIWVFRRNFPVHRVVFGVYMVAGASLWFSAYIGSLETSIPFLAWLKVGVFLLLSVLAVMPFAGLHGVLSELYNYYPKGIRAKLYVTSNLALLCGGIFFALFYDFMINGEKMSYELTLWVAGFSLMVAAFFSQKLPKITFSGGESPSLRKWFRVIKADKLFLYVLVAWSLLGTANLWIVSYRTNLLVEPEFGFLYEESTVFLLVIVVPQVVYLIFNYPFAMFFDRYNFIVLRILINICMGIYVGFFFMSSSFYGHLVGAVFYGVGTSGGNLAWKLWVYKVVPKDKVSVYMNIHSASTGIRMMLAPAFGLIGLYALGPVNAAWISLGILSVSTIMISFLIPQGREKFNY